MNARFYLYRVCQDEEDEEPIERRIHQSDEYYQERVRQPKTLLDTPKYDIDEYVFFLLHFNFQLKKKTLPI